jgi:glycosyltransferase involved in cell wall biosynthesis
VGEGPQRPELEAAIRDRKADRVVLTGFVNQAEIPRYFAAADALAVPSSFDAHPLVVSEGASFGLPIVASDAIGCIGPNDTARPEVNALVHRACDAEGLRRALERLRDDAALRRRLGEASERISEWQDARVAAEALRGACARLRELGPR